MIEQGITHAVDPFGFDTSDASSVPAAGDGAGTLSRDELARRGIVHVRIDQFEVDGYRYSSLKDAIAQSDRAGAAPRR